jgi:hypothetical protein
MLRFRIVGPIVALFALVVATAPAAAAAGPGLPRAYDVQRVDGPGPAADTRGFGLNLINAGDLNSDGKEDLAVSQGGGLLRSDWVAAGAVDADGEIHLLSGSDGSLIRTIPLPEPDGPNGVAGEDKAAAFGASISRLDVGKCADGDGPDPDSICDSALIGQPDGVPDLVVGAPFQDVPTPGGTGRDMGRVYVIDGETGVVLKRIDMPEADRVDQEPRSERLGSSPAGSVRPAFGRAVLTPAGLPPCAGNGGVGGCQPDSGTSAVRIGDLDGGGQPDILVGASFVQDDDTTNPICDRTAGAGNDVCERSGRLYMYRGEDIVGTDPAAIDSTPTWNVKDPVAQSDAPGLTVATEPELFASSVAPVGDVGICRGAAAEPGKRCPPALIGGPDGKPDVLVSAPRVDYPLQSPSSDRFDVGVVLLLDGATGAVLHIYLHPEPQAGSVFGLTISNQPPVGNLGHTALPDVYVPAIAQNVEFRGQGRGYVLNGERTSPDTITLATLNDPTPQASGGFGISGVGVGDLVGDAHNELVVGELSSQIPPQNLNTITDVHIFDPLAEQVVQTIKDPDQQRASSFGASLAPVGDVNGDGFLDLAAGAGRFDIGTEKEVGRVYIFRSNNSRPTPPAPEEPVEEPVFEGDFGDFGLFEEDFGAFDETGSEPPLDRTIKLRSSKARISLKRKGERRPPRVRLTGSVRAFVNQELCEPLQRVLLQRRRSDGPRRLRTYRTFQRTRSNDSGRFKSKQFRPKRTYIYRALAPQTDECPAGASNQVKVTVRKAKRSPKRRSS